MSMTPEFDNIATPELWALRQRMLDGNEQVGLAMVEGRASGEAMEGVRIRVMLVERVDAALMQRGESVPPPWWDVDEDEQVKESA